MLVTAAMLCGYVRPMTFASKEPLEALTYKRFVPKEFLDTSFPIHFVSRAVRDRLTICIHLPLPLNPISKSLTPYL